MPGHWCEQTIRLVMMNAVRLARDYQNDKTESNKLAAFEAAHNAIILARGDAVLQGKIPDFVDDIAAYFEGDVKRFFEGFFKRAKPVLVPANSKLTIDNYSMISENEFWGPDRAVKGVDPKDSKPVIHNHSKLTEAEFWGLDKK